MNFEFGLIPVVNRATKGLEFAVVDAEDYESLAAKSWHISHGYARLSGGRRPGAKRQRVSMHRMILGLSANGQDTDHINRCRLDNRRSNLRVVTHAQNMQNRSAMAASGYRGVYWCHNSKKWQARVKHKGRSFSAGFFSDPREAAAAAAALRRRLLPFSVESPVTPDSLEN